MWNKESSWEIEKMFNDEIRDKKRTGYGGFHNITHRGGGKKGARLKTQVDFLTGKAKREYTKGGIIMTSNIYSDINNLPTWAEIKKKDHDAGHAILKAAKDNHTAKTLGAYWGVSGGTIYSMYDNFGVLYAKKPRKKKEPIKNDLTYLKAPAYEPKQIVSEVKTLLQENNEYKEYMEHKSEVKPVTYVPETKTEQYQLNYNTPKSTGQEAHERVMRLMTTLYPDKQYKIELTVTELSDEHTEKE